MTWLEVAQNLPLGAKVRIDCPECGEGTNTHAAVVNHSTQRFSLYCHACKYNPFEGKGKQSLAELARIRELNEAAQTVELGLELPDDFTTEIPLHGRMWLYKAGITQPVWSAYNIGYSERLDRVILPVYDAKGNLIWYQCRALHSGQKPKYLQPARDRSTIMFRVKGSRNDLRRIVIVEDILSAIRVGKHIDACSLLGTKITTAQAAELGQYSEVTTWLDSDRAGRSGAYKIRKTLGLITEVKNILTDKDPKELSDKEIRRHLNVETI